MKNNAWSRGGKPCPRLSSGGGKSLVALRLGATGKKKCSTSDEVFFSRRLHSSPYRSEITESARKKGSLCMVFCKTVGLGKKLVCAIPTKLPRWDTNLVSRLRRDREGQTSKKERERSLRSARTREDSRTIWINIKPTKGFRFRRVNRTAMIVRRQRKSRYTETSR